MRIWPGGNSGKPTHRKQKSTSWWPKLASKLRSNIQIFLVRNWINQSTSPPGGTWPTLCWCWHPAIYRKRSGRPGKFWWLIQWRDTSAGPNLPCACWTRELRMLIRSVPPGTDSPEGSVHFGPPRTNRTGRANSLINSKRGTVESRA